MIQRENIYKFEDITNLFEFPVLILSTSVGRGMYTLGEAVLQRFPEGSRAFHYPVEEFLPGWAINEDLKRYKFISNNFRFLLYLVYSISFFYYRKYFKEKYFNKSNLNKLEDKIKELGIKTVICISHRAAFWTSSLKRKRKMDFVLWDVLGEYGKNLGYKYLFWEQIDGFLSPLDKEEVGINFHQNTKFIKVHLPARKEFYDIARIKGDPRRVVVVYGFWGQGSMRDVIKLLLNEFPDLEIYAVCGENEKHLNEIRNRFKSYPNVKSYGTVENLIPFLKECGFVITKPGISTILEAEASKRKIFLVKGMPIAEDNNANFAIKEFNAEWFSVEKVREWMSRTDNNKMNL